MAPKVTHLEGHRTLSHSLPKSNTCSNVSEAEIEIRRNNYQNELQPITKGKIKEKHSRCEATIEMNIHLNKSQFLAEKQFNCEQCGQQFPKEMNLEKHKSTIHDPPKMDHSEKQVNVSEAETDIEQDISQNIAENEIKQSNCETGSNIDPPKEPC